MDSSDSVEREAEDYEEEEEEEEEDHDDEDEDAEAARARRDHSYQDTSHLHRRIDDTQDRRRQPQAQVPAARRAPPARAPRDATPLSQPEDGVRNDDVDDDEFGSSEEENDDYERGGDFYGGTGQIPDAEWDDRIDAFAAILELVGHGEAQMEAHSAADWWKHCETAVAYFRWNPQRETYSDFLEERMRPRQRDGAVARRLETLLQRVANVFQCALQANFEDPKRGPVITKMCAQVLEQIKKCFLGYAGMNDLQGQPLITNGALYHMSLAKSLYNMTAEDRGVAEEMEKLVKQAVRKRRRELEDNGDDEHGGGAIDDAQIEAEARARIAKRMRIAKPFQSALQKVLELVREECFYMVDGLFYKRREVMVKGKLVKIPCLEVVAYGPPGGPPGRPATPEEVISRVCSDMYAANSVFWTVHGDSASMFKQIVEKITSGELGPTIFLPVPEINYTLTAFKNGMFDAHNLTFTPWDKMNIDAYDGITRQYINSRFRDNKRSRRILRRAREGDIADLSTEEIMRVFRTPTLNRIFGDQKWERDTVAVFLAFLGRILCGGQRGQYEKWQLELQLHGAPMSGKSALIKLIRAIIPADVIMNIDSAVHERTFGLQGLEGNIRLIMAAEQSKAHDGSAVMDPSIFKAIVGGDAIPIARKNRAQIQRFIKAYFFLVGNEPAESDPLGALDRRVAPFYFPFSVDCMDALLDDKLVSEIGDILPLVTLLYRRMVAVCKRDGDLGSPEDQFSPQMRGFAHEIAMQSMPFYRFLKESKRVRLVTALPEGHRRLPCARFDEVAQLYLEFRASQNDKGVKMPQLHEVAWPCKRAGIKPRSRTEDGRRVNFLDGVEIVPNNIGVYTQGATSPRRDHRHRHPPADAAGAAAAAVPAIEDASSSSQDPLQPLPPPRPPRGAVSAVQTTLIPVQTAATAAAAAAATTTTIPL